MAASRPAPGCPPPCSLAADLGVARNTVAEAYADLVAEGWLTARQGSGTSVARRPVPAPSATSAPGRPTHARPAYDLVPGSPDLSSFPRAAWLKAARRALTVAPHEALDYGDPRGRVELRTALAGDPARARGAPHGPGAHRHLFRLRALPDAARPGAARAGTELAGRGVLHSGSTSTGGCWSGPGCGRCRSGILRTGDQASCRRRGAATVLGGVRAVLMRPPTSSRWAYRCTPTGG